MIYDFCLIERSAARGALGDIAGALDDAEAAITRSAENALAWNARALVRVLKNDNPGALADADRAVRTAPGDAEVRSVRVSILLRLGRAQEAKTEATVALGLLPRIPELLLLRAGACFQLKETEAGLADLETFVARYPDDSRTPATRAQIAELLGKK